MNHKKKFAFLSVTLASMLVFGACNKPAENTSSNQPESTTSAQPTETSQSVAPSESSITSVAPTTSSTNPPSSSSSSSSSTSVAPTVVSIAVNLDNVKTAYTRGEALNLTGLVVTGTFSDGTSRAVRSYTTNPANGTVLDEVGEKDIVVTYKEVTTSFKVTVANQKFTVKFVVNGQEVQSGEVEDGQLAVYNGETPTKAADANAPRYRFKGWDKDLTQPITQDTTFTAVFAEYAAAQMIDDFEAYTSNGDMADAGWKALGYSNETQTWTDNTRAAVSLGTKSVEGNKSLRFDAWENGVGYKFAKDFQALPKSANALKFRLQVPSINTVKVILKGHATIGGQEQNPSFTYTLTPKSSEYVEYIIPVAADGWALWGEAGKSIKAVADWTGIHEDDFVNYMTGLEFYIQGNDGIQGQPYFAFLDSIQFVTIDNPALAEVETMGQYTKYTGVLNNGYTVKVELGANGAATAKIIDMETPLEIPGNVAIDADKNMTFTSADNGASLVYKAALKNGGQSMKFVEASGQMAEAVTNVDLNAVQVVDNFDQYTADGKSYYQNNLNINDRSGARGAYYSEYYSGGSHEYETFGGNGWVLMGGSGDQLKLKQDGGHSGNNYICMKNSGSFAMRYMSWGLFDGTSEQNNFRGSKLSFWAKTNGVVKSFKVSMYSQSKPRNATKDDCVKSETFTQTAAIGEWKHFEVALNPALTYYGFLVFMEKTGGSDAFLYMDDVEVYTADPYAVYVPEVPPVEDKVLTPGMTYIGKVAGLINAQLTIGQDNAVTLAAPGMAMNVNGTYAIEGDEVTMTLGDVQYVGTIEDNAINFKSVNGTGTIAGALNNLNFNMIEYADNAETYESDGKMYYIGNKDVNNRSGARGAYHCDYYKEGTADKSIIGGNNWSLMGGNGDQLSLDKTTAADGSQSLKMKFSTAGNMRYLQWGLADGTAVGHKGFNKFGIYLKNTNANAVSIKLYAYYIQKVEPSTQGGSRATAEITVPANSDWALYTLDLDAAKTYYGYGIYMVTKSSTGYLNVDKAFYYNDYESPEMNYFAKEGLALNGTITAGAATMTFGQNGAVTLNNEALGGDLAGTYTMAMGEAGQLLTVKTSMGNITGTYSVNPMGKVTFTVTEVTGGLAQGVNVGAVLSNQ